MLTWFELLSDKIDFSKEEVVDSEEKSIGSEKDSKLAAKSKHETHGPKIESAKRSTARTRKKV